MNGTEAFRYVIAGAGPTGLACLETLLNEGVSASSILVIDLNPEIVQKYRQKSIANPFTINSVAARERQYSGLGKSGVEVLSTTMQDSPSFYWGLACYELNNSLIQQWEINNSLFQECFDEALENFEVQKFFNPSINPITGVQGSLRKDLASKIIEKNSSFIHSWLALSSAGDSACNLSGGCFDFCEQGSQITPDRLFKKLMKKWKGINFLIGEIGELNIDKKTISVGTNLFNYENLLLCLGAKNSQKLIATSLGIEVTIKGTPVALMPFFSAKGIAEAQFTNHFSYSDLFLPIYDGGHLEVFCQLYLPSVEIAGRIVATLPTWVQFVLSLLGERFTQKVFSHFGICMVFLPETHLLETKASSRKILSNFMPIIRSNLRESQILCSKTFARYLLNGASRHLGGISGKGEKNYGFKSSLWHSLAKNKVFVLDTGSLPNIQPGPHTLIAVALAKYLVIDKVI